MQKRVVYNFNAVENSTDKTAKNNAINKIKSAFSGKSLKLAVLLLLVCVSLFCAIGSADWIISQQKDVPNSQDGIFIFDDLGLKNNCSIPDITFSGANAELITSTTATDGARDLPEEALAAENLSFKVKNYNPDTDILNESFFESGYTTVLPTNAGTYAVLITSKVGEVSYGKTIKVFTIAPCPVKIEWTGNQGFTYDGAAHSITATAYEAAENGNAITENILSISLTYKAPGAADSSAATAVTEVKNAGTYTATATVTNGNYVISSNETYAATATTSFTVEQKDLSVVIADKTVIYGENAPEYTLSFNGLVSTDSAANLGTPEFNCAYTTESAVGTFPITVGGLANSNYNITYVNGTLTVNKRTVTLNWGETSFVYDGTEHTLTPAAENIVNNDDLGLTVTITGAPAINVGNYAATAAISNANYEIAASSQTTTLIITARALTVTANNKTITYGAEPSNNGYTISGFTDGETYESANISGTVKLTTNYTRYADVGEYDIIVDVSGLSSPNYSFKVVNGKLTVDKKELTVTAKDNTITYGDEPSGAGYEITGFVNGDTESVITGLDKITYSFGYKQFDDIGSFDIFPVVKELSATNYSFIAKAGGILTVEALDIQISGTIEHGYSSTGITFNAELFSGATFTAPSNSKIDLSTLEIYKGITAEYAINYDEEKNTTAITDENGLFKYLWSSTIKAGSTYKIVNIELSNTNFKLKSSDVYLKYKTAKIKIGDKTTFYTIEDALAESGDITLCGDAETDDFYVITAFAKLSSLTGSDFKNYKSDYQYTLSGRKLIVPFEDSLTEKTCINKKDAAYGNVYAALVIQDNISLTLNNSASITVGAELSYNQNISCALAEKHGVLSNNGTITAEDGCSVSAYGYIKGTGKIILKSGATCNDVVSIYDFPGGTVLMFNISKMFPSNAFTLHNNACETYIYSGATYTGFTYIVLSSSGYTATAEIVGANSDSGLFAPASSNTNGYIIKKVTTVNNYNINNITTTNQRSSNSAVQHRDHIEVYGSYKDNTMELNVSSYKFQTSTDKPFPVGLMDVIIKTGDLTLEKSSYMVMPGSKIEVEKGAKLSVKGEAKLSAIKYDTINGATGSRKYTSYFSTNNDGKIIVNGELTTDSTAQVGGKIETTEAQASIQLSSSSSSYIMLINTDRSNATLSGTVTPFGNIMTSANSYTENDLSIGTYYSKEISGKFVWYSQTATISFEANGKVISTISRTVGSNGYTISAADFPAAPTKDYYTFENWYIDEALTTKATGQTIFVSCTLYAGWTANTYTITYKFKYNGEEYLPEYVDNSKNKTTYTYEDSFFLEAAVSYQGYKFYRWYSDESCTEIITTISGMGGNITIYGEFIEADVEVYVVTYVTNNDEVATPPAENVKSTEAANFKIANFNNNNNDRSKTKYFLGWYLLGDTTETILTSLPDNISGDITLCAKWDNKVELIIVVDIGGNIVEQPSGKYYYIDQSFAANVEYEDRETPDGKKYKFTGLTANSGCTLSDDKFIVTNNTELKVNLIFRQYRKISFNTSNATIEYTVNGTTITESGKEIAIVGDVIQVKITFSESSNRKYTLPGSSQQSATSSTVSVSFEMLDEDVTIQASSESCLIEGTLITLADGTKKKVEDLTYNDKILVFNHETGKVEASTLLVSFHSEQLEPVETRVINLKFSNGNIVRIAGEHGFFEVKLRKYVYIDESNVTDYLGHSFYSTKYVNGEFISEIVTLDSYVITTENVRIFSPATVWHFNIFAEDILSMPADINGIFGIFDLDENFKYDEEAMQADIEKYGLYTYDDWKDIVPYEVYEAIPFKYFKVAIGKGYITYDEIMRLYNDYIVPYLSQTDTQ